MNRLLRNILIAAGVLLVIDALLFGIYIHVLGGSAAPAKTVWAAAVAGMFLIVFAIKGSLQSKFKIVALLMVCLFIEALLQTLGWMGVLPGVNTKLNVPYGRVYWSGEGRGNSIRNRFGWYYPEFDTKAARRIAVIGDSQVEAVEVHRTRNQAAVLNTLLKQGSPTTAVLGFGSHGTSVAYSIEVLDYAARHFQPQEAIVVVSIGSDIVEASPTLNGLTPAQYIYYQGGSNGTVVLDPRSAGIRQRFQQSLEFNHGPVTLHLPMILHSHCMTLQLAASLRDLIKLRKRQSEIAERAKKLGAAEAVEYQRLGFNPAPFALQRSEEAARAMNVLLGQLQRCKEVADNHHMALRIVTVPAFPKAFYDSQRGRDWTMQLGAYDYLKPEREIVAFAQSNGIPTLAMGDYMRQRHLDVEEIRSLYFSNGMGHLTEKGHRFYAQAVFETFYKERP